MTLSSITANGAPAAGSSRRRTIATAAVVFLVGIGLALGAFKMLSGSPQSSVASLNDVNRYVFVPSRGVAEVAVIDSKTDRVATTIALRGIPDRVLVSEAAGAMVASFAGQSKLEVISLSERGNNAEVDLTITPEFMVLSPDSYLVAAADSTRGAVAVASLQNRKLLFRLEGVGDPRNLTFSQDGSQLYITDRQALELVVVDIVQQWVLSFPIPLRVLFAAHPELLAPVLQITCLPQAGPPGHRGLSAQTGGTETQYSRHRRRHPHSAFWLGRESE